MRAVQGCRLVLVVVLGSLMACDGTEGTPKDATADKGGKPDAGATVQVVGPAGGTLLFHGGKVKLEVPPGALTKDASISVLVPKSYPKDSQLVTGTVYDLLPDGTTFKKPVKLSVNYEQADLPLGVVETDLRIFKVVGSSWKALSGGGVDSKANVAWTKINGFSKYGIKGPSPTTVDSMTDTSVDAAVPQDATKPDAPVADGPNSDLPKPDAPKPDAPKPDAPKPDAPKPDASSDFLVQCVGQPKGSPCNDANPCTKGDACDGAGACKGTSYVCKPAFQCETSRICDGKGGCIIAYKTSGATCDDKNSCTKGDACDGKGACIGTSYACQPSGQCELNGVCDGKGGCQVTYKTTGASCDDKNLCTKSDACDGKGGCTGTPYTCTPGQCEVSSACDGKGGCAAVSKTKGTTCDDKKLCSKNDACDGKGACSGTSYTCTPPSQCHSSTCDGKGGCTVSFKTAGSTCDDKNVCTKDACDGKGGCTGTPYTPKSYWKCGTSCPSGFHVASMKCDPYSCKYCDPYSMWGDDNSAYCKPNCGSSFVRCGYNLSCPSGYYASGIGCTKGCGRCKDGYYPNSVGCKKVSGQSSFTQCGYKCPTGYYAASTSCKSSCDFYYVAYCSGGSNYQVCKKKP